MNSGWCLKNMFPGAMHIVVGDMKWTALGLRGSRIGGMCWEDRSGLIVGIFSKKHGRWSGDCGVFRHMILTMTLLRIMGSN